MNPPSPRELLTVIALFATGCGGMEAPRHPEERLPAETPPADDLSTAEIALSNVPTGVKCVRITVTIGTQTTTAPLLTVNAGATSASLNVGQLPAGAATFNGAAFTAACSGIGSSTPAWIADPAMAVLSPGALVVVPLTFRRNNPVSVTANFLDNVAELATGGASAFARMADGTVKQWGDIVPVGQPATSPLPVPVLSDVAQVAGGQTFACARKNDGTVWCWGFDGGNGVLGPNVPPGGNSDVPLQIPLVGPALDLAAGGAHACAVLPTNQIYCWGSNESGQLGNRSTIGSSTPVKAASGAPRVYAGGRHTCSLRGDGFVMCWGQNGSGQLGIGSATNQSAPTAVTGVTNVAEMALGWNHTCVVRADGVMRCWGANTRGELGDGTNTGRLVPTDVLDIDDALQVAVGGEHTCALRRGGMVSCWGDDVYGQLGDGTGQGSNHAIPTLPSGVVAIRSHLGDSSCAEMFDHTAKCWGTNLQGQLGTGNYRQAGKPTNVLLQ